jgi:hypothetical protein
MFSVKVTTTPIYIMDDNGDISKGIDCTLVYNGRRMQFIENNGVYAYAGFFEDGNWPDEYYENDELAAPYLDGNWVKMINGGWNENLSNLIQTMGFMLISIDDEDEDEIVSFITRLKNGEGNVSDYYGEIGLTLRNYEGDDVYIDYEEELRMLRMGI